MTQKDNIEDLARELGIDYGDSSSQLDRMKRIAEAVGMDHYNGISNADTDELERRLREKHNSLLNSYSSDDSKEEEESKVKLVWSTLPLKYKLIVIGVIAAVISIILFLVVMITPLMELGIIDISGIGSDSSGSSLLDFSSISSSTTYWWPIGGSEVEYINGIEFATGDPTSTTITCKFGNVCYRGHTGMDIGNEGKGSNYHYVIAALDGTVIAVNDGVRDGTGTSYGNYVKIQHGNGDITIYGHLYINSIKVNVGDTVKRGQIIAKMGHSGNSSGPHLHFEIRVNGTPVDPENYVNSKARPEVSQMTGGTSSENKSATCKWLLESGFSNNATAGILVNIEAEGNFLTNNMEGCYETGQCCFNGTYGLCTKAKNDPLRMYANDTAYTAAIDNGSYSKDNFVNDRVGYGLIQWTSSNRKKGLYEAAKNDNKSISDLNIQVNYLFSEITGGAYPKTWEVLTNDSATAYEVAETFCLNFERPANMSTQCPKRAKTYSDSYLKYVENGCK